MDRKAVLSDLKMPVSVAGTPNGARLEKVTMQLKGVKAFATKSSNGLLDKMGVQRVDPKAKTSASAASVQ